MDQRLKQVLSSDQAKLLKYWSTYCRPDRLPTRAELGPDGMRNYLKHVSILEYQVDDDFKFRLTGEGLKEVLGYEVRGRMVSDECGGDLPWDGALRRCRATRSPVFGVTPVGHRRAHHWMRLPLEPVADGRQQILCFDRIQFDEKGEGVLREVMVVTADMVRSPMAVHESAL